MSVLTQVGKLDVELSVQAVLTELPPPPPVPSPLVVPESLPHDARIAKSVNVQLMKRIFHS